MKITIERSSNGFIIFYPDYITDAEGKDIEVTKSYVIEETAGEFQEQEAFVRLCWELMDQFGINNSDHNSRRINIELTEEKA